MFSIKRFWPLCGCLGLLLSGLTAHAEPVRAALFVADRISDPVFKDKTDAFTDLLAAQLAQNGIAVADRRDTVNALANYAGPTKATSEENKLDAALDEQSSALALARAMGVDAIISASMTAYDVQKREFNGYGVLTLNTVRMLYVSARLLDVRQGAALCGVNAVATQTTPENAAIRVSNSDITAPLMAEAAKKLAEAVADQIKGRTQLIAQSKAPKTIPFSVRCTWGDLLFPEVVKTKEGQFRTTQTRYPAELLAATIELNGLVVGATPDEVQAAPGIATLKISREGFHPWSRMINVSEGLSIAVAMRLNDEGLVRWKEMAEFIQGLKDNAQLTEAQVRVLDGYAKQLGQSGVRIDQRQNINVNTTEGIIQNYNQGLIQTPVLP